MKRELLMFIVCVSLSALGQIDSGLVAHWPMDGDALDKSGNNYHGVLEGKMELIEDRFGNGKCALASSDPTSTIKIPKDILIDSTKEVTISYWIRADLLKSDQFRYNILGWDPAPYVAPNAITNHITSGPNSFLDFNLRLDYYSSVWLFRYNREHYDRWIHFVMFFGKPYKFYFNQPAALPKRVYYNNELLYQYNGYQGLDALLPSKFKNFYLAQFITYNSNSGDYRLSIDDVRIYNRQLNVDEISDLFKERSGCGLTTGMEVGQELMTTKTVFKIFDQIGHEISNIEDYQGLMLVKYTDGSYQKILK